MPELFFEKSAITTRSGAQDKLLMPFEMGDISPRWDEAEISANEKMSGVDIPTEATYTYFVVRQRPDGTTYAVQASSKIIVVKSNLTDSMATYIRISIPDEEYAAYYDGNICNMTLNYEDRVDYCGLEYYTTLEGMPVAISEYRDGKCTRGVFLFDTQLSPNEISRRYAALFHNMWIFRRLNNMETRASNINRDDWEYGAPGSTFVDSNGGQYLYVDNDGDGKSDSITQSYSNDSINNGGSGGGYNLGAGFGIGIGDGFGNFGSSSGSGDGFSYGSDGGSGYGGGGGSGSGGSGNSDGSGDSNGPQPPFNPPFNPPSIKYPIIDPLPLIPDIEIPKKDPEEQIPCADSLNNRVNPLLEMKILGTKNNGIKGGRYGKGRGRMHGGLDLDAQIGTPVYAMFNGKVTSIVSKYAPEIKYDDYETLYKNDGESNYNAGNRIWIESETGRGKKF